MFSPNFKRNKYILGSASPRRKSLLSNILPYFTTQIIATDEFVDSNIPVSEVAAYLAQLKSDAFVNLRDDEIVITADTTVVINEQILNKPKDSTEAKAMLGMLSGTCHEVITGVCVRSVTKQNIFSEVTKVEFKALSTAEINHYVDEYKPFDKAGAYGIQEWIGMIGITSITGDYYNVMGLPIQKLYQVLCDF
ncbi:MAG: septum formation protein [Bacteroidia bacterium]|jgi:septum formation protein